MSKILNQINAREQKQNSLFNDAAVLGKSKIWGTEKSNTEISRSSQRDPWSSFFLSLDPHVDILFPLNR
jgi:hypothetical protein